MSDKYQNYIRIITNTELQLEQEGLEHCTVKEMQSKLDGLKIHQCRQSLAAV